MSCERARELRKELIRGAGDNNRSARTPADLSVVSNLKKTVCPADCALRLNENYLIASGRSITITKPVLLEACFAVGVILPWGCF